jgi:hypothetical protein
MGRVLEEFDTYGEEEDYVNEIDSRAEAYDVRAFRIHIILLNHDCTVYAWTHFSRIMSITYFFRRSIARRMSRPAEGECRIIDRCVGAVVLAALSRF